MFGRVSRTAGLTLAFNSLVSTLVVVSAQQTQDQKGSSKAPASENRQTSSRPLGMNEDPQQIGKRNLNKGLIAKLSGSLEKEVALGQQLAAEVDRETKFIDDPVITEYLNRVGQNVALHSDAKVPLHIKVVDSDVVNALTLPGGFIYVNSGLILACDNEAELAGAMAHELGHVAARHTVENLAKANLLEYGALAGSIFLGGVPGLIFQNTAGLGLAAAFLKFSRNAEEEADRLGAQYLYAAGYDPNALSTFFEKLLANEKRKPGFISKAFSTHPSSADRRHATLALVARFPEREEYVINTSEFLRVKARLLRLSNARVTNTASATERNGETTGRPTLKRRQPSPDDSTTNPDATVKRPTAPKK